MADTDKVFSGSIPEIYDRYLVPLIFEDHAADIADRTAALNAKSILETAAGSGVVTRALARRIGPDCSLTVTDLNQPMLDRAASMQGADERIVWRQADALDLPFDDGTFDAVVCQFGAMFFPDKVRAYAEARRVLKPDGVFLFNVWDRIGANAFAETVTQAAARVFSKDPPEFLARTPHGYHDLSVIRSEVEQAGFAEIATETIDGISTAPSARHPAIAYCQGTPLRDEIESRDAGRLEEVTEEAARAIEKRFGSGPVSGSIRGHVILATR